MVGEGSPGGRRDDSVADSWASGLEDLAPDLVHDAVRRATGLLAVDIETTTGRPALFGYVTDAVGRAEARYMFHLTLGSTDLGGYYGTFGIGEDWWTTESVLELMLASLQSDMIEQLASAWPRCPIHGRHPLDHRVIDGQMTWVCAQAERRVAPVGSCPNATVAEPEVPNGVVRWCHDDYGAIADPDGDVWFHFAAIDTANTRRRQLTEGEVVDYEVDIHPQANYRRATWVRRRAT